MAYFASTLRFLQVRCLLSLVSSGQLDVLVVHRASRVDIER